MKLGRYVGIFPYDWVINECWSGNTRRRGGKRVTDLLDVSASPKCRTSSHLRTESERIFFSTNLLMMLMGDPWMCRWSHSFQSVYNKCGQVHHPSEVKAALRKITAFARYTIYIWWWIFSCASSAAGFCFRPNDEASCCMFRPGKFLSSTKLPDGSNL